jgi:peptidoglycan/xylan/chitin deacetylase (PgdA/CDA1 family)
MKASLLHVKARSFLKDKLGFLRYHLLPPSHGAIVLAYHSISEDNTAFFTVSPQTFERQVQFLIREQWKVVPLHELIELLKNKTSIPKRTVVITFDDAYRNFYDHAYPILQKYQLHATVFVSTDMVGNQMTNREGVSLPIMDWSQIEELSQSSFIDVGSHTQSHLDLRTASKEELDRELSESRQLLETRLRKPCSLLAYPKGKHDQTVREAAKKYYTAAVATHSKRVTQGTDLYAIPRRGVYRYTKMGAFRYLLSQ